MTNIGFTGSQHGMTDDQIKAFVKQLSSFSNDSIFIHGGCIGADEQAHYIALDRGLIIEVHPGVTLEGMAAKRGSYNGAHSVYPAKFYLTRNKDIVDNCDILFATPDTMLEKIRSGTWSTVRYAQSFKKPVLIFLPDGSVKYS